MTMTRTENSQINGSGVKLPDKAYY